MSQPRDHEALIEALLADLRRTLEAELPDDAATLDQIEEAAVKVGGEIGRLLQERVLKHRSRLPRDNKTACPTCHQPARYRDMVPRVLTTRLGEVTIHRSYYWCPLCQHGFSPLDQALKLDAGTQTTQVRLFAAHLGALLPFGEAAATLKLLTGLTLSATTLERTAVAIGTALHQAQQAQAECHQAGRLPEALSRPKRLYISLDGTFLPLRDPWKRDGSAGKLTCRYGECKTGVAYEARPSPKGDAGVVSKAYVATLANAEGFAALIGTLGHQQGHHFAKELILLGDGAAWIWRLGARQFPTAIQIVDFYHASDHLYELAHARFGPESPEAKEWVLARQSELKQDHVEQVLLAMAAWKPRNAEKRKIRRDTARYFRHNAERMRYGTFTKKGYHIGSGVAEAACKHVVGQRLDQAGMHWCPATAEAILCLRAALLSTHPPDLRPYSAMAA
jgi:hypothetical protein